MSKTVNQIVGNIIADNVANVNSDSSVNIEMQDVGDEKAYNKKCHFYKVAISFLSLVVFLQLIILSIYAPRVITGNSLGFDYLGVIVAILALLVTFLVAWQIYKTIEVKREMELAAAESRKAKRLVNKCRGDIERLRLQHLGVIKLMQGEVEQSNGKYYDASLSYIDAAKEYAKARDNAGLYVSVCLGKTEVCLRKYESGEGTKVNEIKNLIDRITNLTPLIDGENSAQRLNRQRVEMIKMKLEEYSETESLNL